MRCGSIEPHRHAPRPLALIVDLAGLQHGAVASALPSVMRVTFVPSGVSTCHWMNDVRLPSLRIAAFMASSSEHSAS